MAIVYSYPLNKNIKLSDELVGTTEQMINGRLKTVTRNFLLQDLAEFFIVDGGLQKEITLTTNNTSGAATLDQITGILNIPRYDQGTITPAALTKVNDTNVTLTLGGSPSNALLQGVSLTLGWTGTLADSRIASASTWNAKQNAITTGTNLQYLRGDLSLAIFPTNISSFTNDLGYITNSALIPYITSATAAATYEPKIIAGTTAQYWRGDKTWQLFPTIPTVGTWGTLNYPTWTTGTPFVKMTATGIFSLDTTIYEPALGNPTVNGYVLSSTTTGVRSWVAQSGGGGGGSIPHATASGTDTYTATISGVTSYADGDAYLIRFAFGNTTVCTLNINGLGVIPLYRNNDGPLIGGDIQANGEMLCVYNSTANTFQCIGTSPNSIISYVTNAESLTITKGQVVYAFGGTGDRMTVKLASNISDSTSAQTVGIILSDSIVANQKGFIIFQGLIDNLNILPTSTWADGDQVYLGVTTGSITKVKPYAPNHLVYIGIVTTASNGSAGRMYVRVQNGYELDELHNVQARTPTLKDTLYYDNTVSPAQWKTSSISSILGYTPANDASVVHLTGNETIAGDKNFTGTVNINLSANAFKATSVQGTALEAVGGNNSNPIGKFTRQSDLAEIARFDNSGLKLQLETASTIASFDTNKNIVSLTTANGYPTLTELKSLVGVSTTNIQTQLNGKQPINANLTSISTLSTTSGASFVKVYNGAYFLDSVSGSPQSAYTMMANNTASSAVPTEQAFENLTNQTYSGTIVWAPGAAPSTNPQHTYSLSQVGNLVTLIINLSYGAAGASTLTSVACELPSTAPLPALPTSVLVALDIINYGTGVITTSKNLPTTNLPYCALRIKSVGTPNVYEVVVTRGAAAYRYAYVTIQYFV